MGNMSDKSLEEFVKELPPDIQAEVKDFAEFLIERRKRKTKIPLRQDWAGALRDFRDKYTSLELQQKASGWRDCHQSKLKEKFIREDADWSLHGDE